MKLRDQQQLKRLREQEDRELYLEELRIKIAVLRVAGNLSSHAYGRTDAATILSKDAAALAWDLWEAVEADFSRRRELKD